MPILTDLVQVLPPDREEEQEDIYASASWLLFPDDTRNTHGDPGSVIVYKSRNFGAIELRTADPNVEEERQLFSHYLWNAGIKMSELIGSLEPSDAVWRLEGEKVLELGAGVGLSSIVATLAGAEEAGTLVVVSDYPAAVVLDNIRRNAKGAVPQRLEGRYRIEGHEWGVLDTSFALLQEHYFTRIVAADCLWMTGQHFNLVQSMLHFLTLDPSGRVFAIAGFHTGRAKLASFFDVAVEQGLEVEEMYEEDVEGTKRPWEVERNGGKEDVIERKRWLVIARLRRRADGR